MNHKLLKSISLLAVAALFVAVLALAFPSGSVAAQGINPPDETQQSASDRTDRLERLYQRELKTLENQEERYTNLVERIQDARQRIDELKAAGKDVSALEDALADFQAQVDEARASHTAAAAILNARAGFDADGKVTDIDAAHETVREAGELLREARTDIRPALRQLARAFREFLRDNR